jgi:Flp pilus assembly protein TadG
LEVIIVKNFQNLSSEKGAALIIFTIMLVAMLSFSALVVDIGNVMVQKAGMQADIDAIALAAAQDLPDTVKAEDVLPENKT